MLETKLNLVALLLGAGNRQVLWKRVHLLEQGVDLTRKTHFFIFTFLARKFCLILYSIFADQDYHLLEAEHSWQLQVLRICQPVSMKRKKSSRTSLFHLLFLKDHLLLRWKNRKKSHFLFLLDFLILFYLYFNFIVKKIT